MLLLAYVLMLTFCHLHSSANSKTIADNGNLQVYSEESLWDPTDMDTQFLTDTNKLVPVEKEQKFGDFLEWNPKNMNHMNKRTFEQYLPYINEDDYAALPKQRRATGARDARGDNFMRFGRTPHDDYMRFGRSPHEDFMRFGRSAHDGYMRFGRSAADDYMRFGRSPHDNYMRFGRDSGADFLRFGRAGKPLDKTNVDDIHSISLRYVHPENFMRFGRTAKSNEKDLSPDFMRFGRSVKTTNKTKTNVKTGNKH